MKPGNEKCSERLQGVISELKALPPESIESAVWEQPSNTRTLGRYASSCSLRSFGSELS
eukprot:COSAG03_NODE_21_length_21000_cov_26.440649_16_plen_59_part_00